MENQPDRHSSPYSHYPAPARPYGAQNQPAYPASPPSYPPEMPGAPAPLSRPPKNYPWLTIVVAMLLVVFFGVLFAAAVSKSNSAGGASSATATPVQTSRPTGSPTRPPTSPVPGAHKMFDVVNIDNWLVTVYATKLSVGGQYDTLQHPGDIFLEISVSIINETGRPQMFSGLLAFRLKDITGQTYNQTYVVDAGNPPDGTVANGGKLTGTIAYEVPKTMHTFEFAIAPNLSNLSKIAVWSLTV